MKKDVFFDDVLCFISVVIMCLIMFVCGIIIFLELIKNKFCLYLLMNIVLIIGFIFLSIFCIYVSIYMLIEYIKDYNRRNKK